MLTIYKSKVFQEDYQKYQSKIEEVSNEIVKTKLNELLNNLVAEVRKIDALHQDVFARRSLADATNDSKLKVIKIRKDLDKILKDWAEAQSN